MERSEDQKCTAAVKLFAYDLKGLLASAESNSCSIICKDEKDGIWYSGLVAYGKEYFFSKMGVEAAAKPGEHLLGKPTKIEKLGISEIPFTLFLDYVLTLGETKYRPGSYDLRSLNGNNFTDDLAQFLCGVAIPKYILLLPHIVYETPIGEEEVLPLLAQITKDGKTIGGKDQKSQSFLSTYIPRAPSRQPKEDSPDFIELQAQVDAIKAKTNQRSLQVETKNESIVRTGSDQRKEVGLRRKRVSFGKEGLSRRGSEDVQQDPSPPPLENRLSEPDMADPEHSSQVQEDPAAVEKPTTNQKPAEPPVTFRDFDHVSDFENLVRMVVTLLNSEEQDRLREMEDWIIKNEGTWVLAEGFNAFLGRILHDKSMPSEARVAMVRLLAYGAGQDDIVLLLHMDRKDHLLMSYAQEFDRVPIQEQEAIALLFANLFETNSSSEWLLYISEWSTGSQQDLSNIRVTTKVAVNALLGDTPTLQKYGSAIMHNLGTKEVFDDVCTELAMAILQFFQGKPSEEHVFCCMKALDKFCSIAHREVPQLVKMVGPEPSKFSGMSPRIDSLIQSISARLAAVSTPTF